MKKINERCPLSEECGKKNCEYVRQELECSYYLANSRPGYEIEDQEAQRPKVGDDAFISERMGDGNRLVYIPAERLVPHPDNPRKELGDLTELAASIKENGIFQNLTVVPEVEDRFTVIIGHRRLAAAKLAGLTELPCVIVEMTPKEQVQTMLLENMQREDLTPYEQAQGFQMMIDLGTSIKDLAKDTGFSQATIKRRLEWAKLDKKEFEKASARQISMADLDSLSKIEDMDKRNEALKALGTKNFGQVYQEQLRMDKFVRVRAQWLRVLETFAKPIPEADLNNTYSKYTWVTNLSKWRADEKELEKPDDADAVQYFYKDEGPNAGITVYKEKCNDPAAPREESEAEKVRRLRDEKDKKKKQEMDGLAKEHFLTRAYFVRCLDNPDTSQLEVIWQFISEFFVRMSFDEYWPSMDSDVLEALIGIKIPDGVDEITFPYDKLFEEVKKAPTVTVFRILYSMVDGPELDYWDWHWEYQPVERRGYYCLFKQNGMLDSIYDYLIRLGYEVSDEEDRMRNGTHRIFDKLPEATD